MAHTHTHTCARGPASLNGRIRDGRGDSDGQDEPGGRTRHNTSSDDWNYDAVLGEPRRRETTALPDAIKGGTLCACAARLNGTLGKLVKAVVTSLVMSLMHDLSVASLSALSRVSSATTSSSSSSSSSSSWRLSPSAPMPRPSTMIHAGRVAVMGGIRLYKYRGDVCSSGKKYPCECRSESSVSE